MPSLVMMTRAAMLHSLQPRSS